MTGIHTLEVRHRFTANKGSRVTGLATVVDEGQRLWCLQYLDPIRKHHESSLQGEGDRACEVDAEEDLVSEQVGHYQTS